MSEQVAEVQSEEAVEQITSAEKASAEKFGLIKKEEKQVEHEEQSSDDTKQAVQAEEKKEVKPSTFEEMDAIKEKNPAEFHKNFSSNEKAIYFKLKGEKRARQEAQKELEDIKTKVEFSEVQSKSAKATLERIKAALDNPDNLTVEQLKEIVEGTKKVEEVEEDKPLTKKTFEEIERKKREEQVRAEREREFIEDKQFRTEALGRELYTDFEDKVKQAMEVVSGDASGFYQERLQHTLKDKNSDEHQLIDLVVKIASLNPKSLKSESKQSNPKAERIANNANKQSTSANIGSSGTNKSKSHEELTVEDAGRMSLSEWSKLPKEVRERIKRESS